MALSISFVRYAQGVEYAAGEDDWALFEARRNSKVVVPMDLHQTHRLCPPQMAQ
jgi:hypothetical protein